MVWLNNQTLERNIIRQLVKGSLEENYMAETLYMADHIHSHQRVTSVEEGLNNWMGKRCILWILVNSLQEFIITQWAREQNGHGGKERGCAWVQPIRRSLMKADLATLRAKCPSANWRVQQWAPNMAPGFALIHSARPLFTLSMNFPSLPTTLLPEPPSVDLQMPYSLSQHSTQFCF